jgi:hypothetical protein
LKGLAASSAKGLAPMKASNGNNLQVTCSALQGKDVFVLKENVK